MSADLRDAFHRAATAVPPMGDAERAVRSSRRRRRAATVAAPVAVLAVVGGAWFVSAGSLGGNEPRFADSSPSPVTAADLAGRHFVATGGLPQGDHSTFLAFASAELRVSAPRGGHYAGYRIDDGVLAIEPATYACAGDCDSALMDLILEGPTISLVQGTLTLSGAERAVTMTEFDGTEADPVEPDVRLFSGVWLLTGAAGTTSLDLAPDGSLQLQFGCSSGSGQVTFLNSGTFTVDKLSTDGGCSGVDTEFRTQQVLTGDVTYQFEGGTLTLTSAGGKLVYQAASIESDEGDATLTGRTWVLESIADGNMYTGLLEGTRSTVEFADGAVSIDHGCTTASADVTVTRSTIEIGSISTRAVRCVDPAEAAVQRFWVDYERLDYTVDGDELTVRGEQGRLVYRAADAPAEE